jgi:serine/threonine-protein kinase
MAQNRPPRTISAPPLLKARQRFGKYRIERRLATGGFASVYKAFDTVEGIHVALKIPLPRFVNDDLLSDFRREVRLSAGLDHPYILPIKNADFIDDIFAIAYPLGDGSLTDRLQRRLSTKTALHFSEQIMEAAAFAHHHRIVHCDIKPDNFILFGDELRLSDFGIAKLAQRNRTISAGGTGTLGYVAPEQAFGRPSFRSDVFAIGLVIYRMLAGELPEWPYAWPPLGIAKLRASVHSDLINLLRRSLEMDPKKRFADGGQMLSAFLRIKPRLVARTPRRKRREAVSDGEWRLARFREFRRRYGKVLETRHTCGKCSGPISEFMPFCPWCGAHHRVFRQQTRFPGRCPRCKRGVKADWRFCPWCYGASIQEPSTREYDDVRYSARCKNAGCGRKDLMPFMRYCPWCRTKVQRPWKVEDSKNKCPSCSWGVLGAYWSHCPWCGRRRQAG